MVIRHRFMLMVVMVVSLVVAVPLVTSCAGGVGPPVEPPTEAPEPTAVPVEEVEPAPTPTEAPEPTAVPTEEAESTGGPTIIDMDAIFPPGRGRELSVMRCTGCHNFVPLVILQLNAEEWDLNARNHRDRTSAMSDEDYEILYTYLKENFGPDDPVPELPQELLEHQWVGTK